jgi:hypothetical protein
VSGRLEKLEGMYNTITFLRGHALQHFWLKILSCVICCCVGTDAMFILSSDSALGVLNKVFKPSGNTRFGEHTCGC